MSNLNLSTRKITLMAIFAALSVVIIRFIPGIPIVGVPGSEIKFDAAIAPVYGLVIGPYLGFLAAFIGGLLTSGSPFTFLTSFAPAFSAMVAGFLTADKISEKIDIPGWIPAAGILGLFTAGWYLTWVGIQAPFYPVLHLAGVFAILITRKWTAKAFSNIGTPKEGWDVRPSHVLVGIVFAVCAYMFSKSYVSERIWFSPYLSIPFYLISAVLILYGVFGGGKYSFLSTVFLACYCGIVTDHMIGNLIFIGVIDLFIPLEAVQATFPPGVPDIPSLFMYVLPVSVAERVLMTIVASILGVGLLMALHRAGLLTREK
ncbi:MAG: ECF transporter S component [Thermoproteota archaeon]